MGRLAKASIVVFLIAGSFLVPAERAVAQAQYGACWSDDHGGSWQSFTVSRSPSITAYVNACAKMNDAGNSMAFRGLIYFGGTGTPKKWTIHVHECHHHVLYGDGCWGLSSLTWTSGSGGSVPYTKGNPDIHLVTCTTATNPACGYTLLNYYYSKVIACVNGTCFDAIESPRTH